MNCAISRAKHKQDTAIQNKENIVWREDEKSILFDKFASAGFQEAIDSALASSDTDINSAASIFTNAVLESCMKKINYYSTGNFKANRFDEECF